MKVTVKLSGGLETLAGGLKEWAVEVEETATIRTGELIRIVSSHIIRQGQTHLFSSQKQQPEGKMRKDEEGEEKNRSEGGVVRVRRSAITGEGLGIKAGVLVLVNDVDWEILGCEEKELVDGDVVDFISTLHGG
eukprot:GHVS01051060.1.p1 GENE.GHVS01051060.1~~GHVS01051060.1.p1  ORF type:complete len:134 (-),score=31.66 GHVS01051060.1:188-589(-)